MTRAKQLDLRKTGMNKRVQEHLKNENKVSKSNALFNILFLIFSFAIIAIASGNLRLTDEALTKSPTQNKETEILYEEEYTLNTNISKAIYQHKI